MKQETMNWRIPPPWPLLVLLYLIIAYGLLASCNSSKKTTDRSVSKYDSTSKSKVDSSSKTFERKETDSSGKKEWESETVIHFNNGGKIKLKNRPIWGKFNVDKKQDSSDTVVILEGVNKVTHRENGKDTSSKKVSTETKGKTDLKKEEEKNVNTIQKEKSVNKQTKRLPWYLVVGIGLFIILIIYRERK